MSKAWFGSDELARLERGSREHGKTLFETLVRGLDAVRGADDQASRSDREIRETIRKPTGPADTGSHVQRRDSDATDDVAEAMIAAALAPPQKNKGAALALWFFFGPLGGPWWYLGHWGWALVKFLIYGFFSALFILSLVAAGEGHADDARTIFGIALVGWLVTVIFDGVSVSAAVDQYNRDREERIRGEVTKAKQRGR